MSNLNLKEILEIKGGGHKRRRRALRPPTASKSAEVWYRDQLIAFVEMMQNIIIDDLNNPTFNDATSHKYLSLSAKLSRAIHRLSQLSIDNLANKLSLGMIRRSNAQNKKQSQRAYKEAFGIDLTGMLSDGVVSDYLKEALTENVGLIKSIQNDFINDIGSKVFSELHEGGRHENLVQLIKERGEVSQSRAKLIARDQTAKLNSALTEARSKSLGLDLYIWGCTGDERTRVSHWVLRGMLCKYSDPTVYSDDDGKTWKKRKSIGAFIGNPGGDYQCRCLAKPKVIWD